MLQQKDIMLDANEKGLFLDHLPSGVQVEFNSDLSIERNLQALEQAYEDRNTIYVIEGWTSGYDQSTWCITHTKSHAEALEIIAYLDTEEKKFSTVPGHEDVNYSLATVRQHSLQDLKNDPRLLKG